MSTSPQPGGQRVIYVNLEHEPEVTQDVCTISLTIGGLWSLTSFSSPGFHNR